MRIQGQLDGDILINLLQYLNLNGASGVLRLRTGLGSTGDVYTRNGQVLHAATGDLTGQKALVTLLRWTQGRFSFEAGVTAPERTIDKPLDALLLEIAYQTDVEDRTGEMLKASTVLMPAANSGNRTSVDVDVTLPVLALKVLPLLDQNVKLSTIARRIGAPVEDVLAAADVIVRSGLATPHQSASVSPEFIHNLTALVRDIIGPLADIVMDEVLYELNLTQGSVPEDQLAELVANLGGAIEQERSDWRAAYDRQVAELLRRSGYLDRK